MNHTLRRLHVPSRDMPTMSILEDDESREVAKGLELKWADNAHNQSCIPPGDAGQSAAYRFAWMHTLKHPEGVYQSNDVPGRPAIELHIGDFADEPHCDTDGCVLVVSGFANVNGRLIGVASTPAYGRFLALHPTREPFTLTVINPSA